MLLNMDLQRDLETLRAETSPICYKRKVAVYNMTIFNLVTRGSLPPLGTDKRPKGPQ